MISIEFPISNEILIHYSNDETKLDDWKADGMLWQNKGQKLVNHNVIKKMNISIYRIINHLKIGHNNYTNKFTKNVFQMPGSLSPTLIWYEGDESLHVPKEHTVIQCKIILNLFRPSHRIANN